MSCYAPLQAYAGAKVNPETGKRPMQFRLHGSYSGVRQMLPCGKCIGCRLERSRRWAIRLMHEMKMHQENCFLTLTYDNENLPQIGTLVKEHLQGFHKRLHNRLLDARGFGIRYFGVGEYGDLNWRPHYHSIIFGYDFVDKVKWSKNGRGDMMYTSKLADEIWTHGRVILGSVNFESAGYVARYCLKKVDGEKRERGHYAVYDADGVIHERLPEFAHMSRRPGIGSSYFEKYGQEIAIHDTIIVNSKEVPSIRYYDEKINKLRLEEIKRERRNDGNWSERQVDRRRTKEKLTIITAKRKERPL